MRLYFSLSLFFACLTVALLVHQLAERVSAFNVTDSVVSPTDVVSGIEAYEDLDYGFSVAVPMGWNRLVSDSSYEHDLAIDSGYSVGFESPKDIDDDLFADYLLIEILPKETADTFASDGTGRRNIVIDGMSAWTDTVTVDGVIEEDPSLELTIYQAEIKGLGFTVGLYAIGETRRSEVMSTAFQIMIKTFSFLVDPYLTA